MASAVGELKEVVEAEVEREGENGGIADFLQEALEMNGVMAMDVELSPDLQNRLTNGSGSVYVLNGSINGDPAFGDISMNTNQWNLSISGGDVVSRVCVHVWIEE